MSYTYENNYLPVFLKDNVAPTKTEVYFITQIASWPFLLTFVGPAAEPVCSLFDCFGAGVIYAHIYLECLHCTFFSDTILLQPIMFFILLYMMLYKHISYPKSSILYFLNKLLFSFYSICLVICFFPLSSPILFCPALLSCEFYKYSPCFTHASYF